MTESFCREISFCRICSGRNLESVLDLGHQALGSLFPRADEPDPATAPLSLWRCTNCGLVQLRHSVQPSALYTYGYGYRSGLNASMRGHLAQLTDWVVERCALKPGDIVVDIGCNDGTLLKSYRDSGLRRVGIDAIAGKFREHYPADIRLHEGFFSAEAYSAVCGTEKAKVITSIAMFYDLESPNDFVAAVRSALAADGVWVLEQSYLPTMLETNAYDTICHEHLEYYALRQIEWLAETNGLRVFDVELNSCNGGSFRLAVCHKDGPYQSKLPSLDAVRKREESLALNTARPYQDFASRIATQRDALVSFVDRELAAGKSIYLYGASTKGNTLLQYCGLDARKIVAAAERNPEKYGCRTPATSIPIVSEDEARAAEPDYFLVLPWHFRQEFVEREAKFRERGGKLIFPLPRFEIV